MERAHLRDAGGAVDPNLLTMVELLLFELSFCTFLIFVLLPVRSSFGGLLYLVPAVGRGCSVFCRFVWTQAQAQRGRYLLRETNIIVVALAGLPPMKKKYAPKCIHSISSPCGRMDWVATFSSRLGDRARPEVVQRGGGWKSGGGA